jgi:hypothetical protein
VRPLPLPLLLLVLLTFGSALAEAAPESREEVTFDLQSAIFFDVDNLAAPRTAARTPMWIAFRHARLQTGRSLRFSLRLEGAPPGLRLAFRGRDAEGGSCAAGILNAGDSATLFEGAPGAVTGRCQIDWTLETPGVVRRAGRIAWTLRWTLESVPAPALGSSTPAPRERRVPDRETAAAGGGSGRPDRERQTGERRPPAGLL